MKKIIIGIFSFTLVLAAQNVIAATVWNGASNDCPGIAIANHTTNTGIVSPCWPLSSVSSEADDSVNVRIYYHNTSGQNATNVKILLSTPTTASSSHTISGQIISDQGNLSLGTVNVTTPSGSKLIFGGTHWLPNQSQTESALLYNQEGSVVLSSGLNIGTIASNWASQGSVVVTFSVETPAPTGTLTASQSSCFISAGQSSCLIPFSWNTVNPVGTSVVTKDGVLGDYKTSNSGSNVSFTIPNGNSIFRLYNGGIELDTESVSASCASGSNWDNSSLTCKIPVYDCKIISFNASPLEIASGDGTTLSWTTEYCNSISIEGVGSNLLPNSSKLVWPSDTTTFNLTGYGDTSVSPTSSVQVIVGGPVGAPGYPVGAPGYSD